MTHRVKIHFKTGKRGKKELKKGAAPAAPLGRIPRITRLMALAIKLEELLKTGDVPDYIALAEIYNIDRSNLTKLMNLRLLAPDIQERLLCLPRVQSGSDPITFKQVLPIAREQDWEKQSSLTQKLFAH